MLVLALDTTTPSGSLALRRDGVLVEVRPGDGARSPSSRLPGELIALLDAHGAALGDVNLFAVASGPGSLTGMRVGIATVQGLSFATGRPIVGVSALDALVASSDLLAPPADEAIFVAAWMHAHRGEVFASLYRRTSGPGPREVPGFECVEAASVGRPEDTLARWLPRLGGASIVFIGDAVDSTRDRLASELGDHCRVEPAPLLAGTVAVLAEHRALIGRAGAPHAIRPTYVRRPDAEVARERRLEASGLAPHA